LGVKLDCIRIPVEDTKKPEYLKKHPFGRIPTLEGEEGCIFESVAIMRHIARKAGKMYGNTPAETASIDQWLEYFISNYAPCSAVIVRTLLAYRYHTKVEYELARKELF